MRQDSSKGKYIIDLLGVKAKNNMLERWNNKWAEDDYPDIETIRRIAKENIISQKLDALIYVVNSDSSVIIIYKDEAGDIAEVKLEKYDLKRFSKEHSSCEFACFVYRNDANELYEAMTWQ